MISLVVVTHNSEAHIEACLTSARDFADEIIVFDLESIDRTQQISKKLGASIIAHPHVSFVELVRMDAISLARGDWVLVLDPDERITPQLAAYLLEIAQQNEYAAINICRKNIFFGTWITHSNFWPDRQIRFFQRSAISWPKVIHTYPIVDGNILEAPAKPEVAIIHYGYSTVSEFLERQNRYSTVAARGLYAAGHRFSWSQLIWQPIREVLVRGVKHAGFLDGLAGISVIAGLVIYQISVQVKLWENEYRS